MTGPIAPLVSWDTGTADALAFPLDTAGLVVVADLSIRWGRDGVLEQGSAATARVTLLDRTRRWAVDNDLVGRRLILGYTHPAAYVANFVGRIAEVRVRPFRRSGEEAGSLVDLTLSSLVTDLANRTSGVAWPEEGVSVRAGRVVTAAVTSTLAGVDLPSGYETAALAPVAAGDQQSHLATLQGCFDACGGSAWNYDPQTRRAVAAPRRAYTTSRGPGRLIQAAPGDDRAGQGWHLAALEQGGDLVDPVEGYVRAGWLDAADTEYDVAADGLTLTAAQRLSGVRLTYKRAASGYAEAVQERTIAGVNTAALGERLATLETDLTTDAASATAADELADRVARDGAAWRMESLTWRGTGFPDRRSMELLLAGTEQPTPLFLQRSFRARLGLRPVVAVIGATIEYGPDGWTITLSTTPVVTTGAQHSITWAEMSGVTVYTDGLPHADALHPSVTPADLKYASSVGAAAPGADTGEDGPHAA